ncbi:hypothetical protein RHSIM_Rhsim06G0191800 [Rhododendron simsii]|uniref:UspA domain-containing protein n=1 Tax=Rhododendron simsii TaxID=118357 RepID=A0A834GUZ2_RHOSS|nr:hypothetical protein RHSIM_Rhsim06G0191800 [Rhododendron simsii]
MEPDLPPLASIKVKSSSPRFPPSTATPPSDTPTANAQRRIGIAVDLSDESAFAVKWAVHHYLRPGDAVILLHVRPTSVLYGADWGAADLSITDQESQQKLEDEFDTFTVTKSADLAQPLVDEHIPYKIHIVKDHDMKERLCLEVERLGLSAVIMGSRGFGARKRGNNGRLGSVSDYCVRHCVCPVVVVSDSFLSRDQAYLRFFAYSLSFLSTSMFLIRYLAGTGLVAGAAGFPQLQVWNCRRHSSYEIKLSGL